MDLIYLDNNASTPLLGAAWEAMQPYFLARYANPASSHQAGRHARTALEDAREQIATLLDCHPAELIFTSGATEANNLAVFGLAGAPPGTIVTSALEHPSVAEPVAQLATHGFSLNRLAVTQTGIIEFPQLLPENTRLLTVQLANHETGALEHVQELTQRFAGVPLHCDAAAAAGKTPISFRQLGAAALTISAHKFHGPKGIGALIVRKDLSLQPQLFGGHQQQGKRPGTEPVPLAVGMAVALAWSLRNLETHCAKIRQLRALMLSQLRHEVGPVVLNGPEEGGLPHTLNLSFPGCKADILLMNLDLAGVACATGSACSSGSLLPSPVLQAMRVPDDVLHSALRFSLSPLTTERDVVEASRRISLSVKQLRSNLGVA